MSRSQFTASRAFTCAHKAAARAARRGDITAADKWLRVAERHERLALRLYKLREAEIALAMTEAYARDERKRMRNEART